MLRKTKDVDFMSGTYNESSSSEGLCGMMYSEIVGSRLELIESFGML